MPLFSLLPLIKAARCLCVSVALDIYHHGWSVNNGYPSRPNEAFSRLHDWAYGADTFVGNR